MQKTTFSCNACGSEGTIKLTTDHAEVEVCPVCGSCLDLDTDLDEDEE